MKLFEPVRIGKTEIKNRIAAPAIPAPGLVSAMSGGQSQRTLDYYAERARGGVGLIITSSCKVENQIEYIPGEFMPVVSWASRAFLAELTGLLHSFDTRLFVQLTPGAGHNLSGAWIARGARPVSASGISCFWRPDLTAREISLEEINTMVKAFAEAAQIVASAGVDGIELHGHGGYLLDEFTTPVWNSRQDAYGGDLAARMRFPLALIQGVRQALGRDFPIVYRYGLKHYLKGPRAGALPDESFTELGRDVEEGKEIARILEQAGVDALHVGAGCFESIYWALPPTYQKHGCMIDMARQAKEAVGIPVIAAGRLEEPGLVENALAGNKCDMVALGRGLLADPRWPAKVRMGKAQEIRPCIGCFDGCLGRRLDGTVPVSCSVNPFTGRERLSHLDKAIEPKKVLIVGGGLSGMEAALVCLARGHRVTICERNGGLGGHLIAGSAPHFKADIRRLLDWYVGQLEASSARVLVGVEATADTVLREAPNALIVATGSAPSVPDIAGIAGSNVANAVDVLLGRKAVGQNVVVVGAGLTGAETALWLSQEGKRVRLIEALPDILAGVPNPNRAMLLDMLALGKVEVETNSALVCVKPSGPVFLRKGCDQRQARCDTVVLALGLRPLRGLYQALYPSGAIPEVYSIGDCRSPGKILDAIRDGFNVGCAI